MLLRQLAHTRERVELIFNLLSLDISKKGLVLRNNVFFVFAHISRIMGFTLSRHLGHFLIWRQLIMHHKSSATLRFMLLINCSKRSHHRLRYQRPNRFLLRSLMADAHHQCFFLLLSSSGVRLLFILSFLFIIFNSYVFALRSKAFELADLLLMTCSL